MAITWFWQLINGPEIRMGAVELEGGGEIQDTFQRLSGQDVIRYCWI